MLHMGNGTAPGAASVLMPSVSTRHSSEYSSLCIYTTSHLQPPALSMEPSWKSRKLPWMKLPPNLESRECALAYRYTIHHAFTMGLVAPMPRWFPCTALRPLAASVHSEQKPCSLALPPRGCPSKQRASASNALQPLLSGRTGRREPIPIPCERKAAIPSTL